MRCGSTGPAQLVDELGPVQGEILSALVATLEVPLERVVLAAALSPRDTTQTFRYQCTNSQMVCG